MNTSISRNIKRLRQKAGFTQEQLAEKLFVTRQTVSLWETGKTQPDVQTLEHIAEVFNVDLMTVLYGAEMPKKETATLRDHLRRWLLRTCLLWIAVIAVQWISNDIAKQIILNRTDLRWLWKVLGTISQYTFYYACPLVGAFSGGFLARILQNVPENLSGLQRKILGAAATAVCGLLLLLLGTEPVTFWFRQIMMRSCLGIWLLTVLVAGIVWGILKILQKR